MIIRKLAVSVVAMALVSQAFAQDCATTRGDWLKLHHKCLKKYKEVVAESNQPPKGLFAPKSDDLVSCFEQEKREFPQFVEENGSCASFVPDKLEKTFEEYTKACFSRSNMDKCGEKLNGKKVDNIRNAAGATLLMAAAQECDLNAFNYLISLGADVKKWDHRGRSVLHYAVSHKYLDGDSPEIAEINNEKAESQKAILEKLLSMGVSVNDFSLDGDLPLAEAIYSYSVPTKMLLNAKAKATMALLYPHRSGSHMSVIADVVYNGHVEGLKDLLAAGVNPNEANYPVPLWGLVWSDKKENDIGDSIAKILLEAKLDPNGFIDAGRTQSAFADALRAPSPSFVIQAFIKAKVKVNDLVWDGEHYDPLLDAIARNDLEVVRMVLQAGYNTKGIAAKLNSGAEINAFEYAIAAKNVEVVKELLKKKPDVNRKIKRDDGEMTSPLCIAVAQDDNSEIVTLLLKSGAKVNQMCSDGSPLLAAVKKQDVESVRALVKAKANVNETINSEGTKLAILDFAQYLGNDEIVDILKKAGATVPFRGSFVDYCLNANITEKMVLDAIKDGADVNETESEQGWTPLHAIAQNGKDPKAMAVLIKRGAIVNAMTRTGFTPFLSAAKNNPNPAFLKMLIAAGADIDAKTSEGFGALQIAIAYNSPAVVSLLLNTSLGNNLSNRSKNILVIDAVRINPDPKVLIALFKAGFKAEPEESWLDKPLHAALESKRSLEVIKILLQGKAVVDDRAMRLARDLPMGSAEENKYRNTVIDMLTKAKKKQR